MKSCGAVKALKQQHYTATGRLIGFLGEARHSKVQNLKIVVCLCLGLIAAVVDVNIKSCLDCALVPSSWQGIVIHKKHGLFVMKPLNPPVCFCLQYSTSSFMFAFIVALPAPPRLPASCEWLTEVAG